MISPPSTNFTPYSLPVATLDTILDDALELYDRVEVPNQPERLQELEPLPNDPTIIAFRNDLRRLSYYSHNSPQDMASQLFRITPESLSLQHLVDCIFEECAPKDTSRMLDAIHFRYPEFTLSPLRKIYKAIAEDTDHLLTNDSLQDLFRKQGLEITEERLQSCIDWAYRAKHPNIYRVSTSPISSDDCNLNFVWVNLNPQDRNLDTAQNIFGHGLDPFENDNRLRDPKILRTCEATEQVLSNPYVQAWHKLKNSGIYRILQGANAQPVRDPKLLQLLETTECLLSDNSKQSWSKLKASFTYRISKWADLHPNGQINLWYDSALVTQKAQQKTFEMVQAIARSRGVNFTLRDTRDLKNTPPEIARSLHPATPVYYRVDMLKILIADYFMRSPEKPKLIVVTDVDVKAMPLKQLFDQRTVDFLNTRGYVFNGAGTGAAAFENSFFIFNKDKPGIQAVHYEIMVEKMGSPLYEFSLPPHGARLRYELCSQSAFANYNDFLLRVNEEEGAMINKVPPARKIVDCPPSQFNYGGHFQKSDHQAETFRFIGDSDVPYTFNGRGGTDGEEIQIPALVNWEARPLPAPS